MTADSPFDQEGLPSAQRVIAGEVADVYGVIDQIDRWSLWVDGLVAPVRTIGAGAFEMSSVREGTTTTHQLVITGRGPVHTLFAEVDGQYRICFRTRPSAGGTHVHVVAEPIGKPRLWQRLGRHQARLPTPERLRQLLDELAIEVGQRRHG